MQMKDGMERIASVFPITSRSMESARSVIPIPHITVESAFAIMDSLTGEEPAKNATQHVENAQALRLTSA